MARCSFNDCQHVSLPCSKIAFFSLPKDWRRSIWIENSGNKELKTISDTTKRLFCEKHFDDKYFKKQFNRTTLLKSAVPFKYADITDKQNECKISVVPVVTSSSNDNELIEVIEDEYLTEENLSDNNEIYLNVNELSDNTNYKVEYDDKIIEIINENDVETDDVYTDTEIAATTTTQKDTNKRKMHNKNTKEACNFSKKSKVIIECEAPKHEQRLQQQQQPDQKTYNEDEHFALSLVGQLQRLPNAKKAIAKISILKYLMQLELGSMQSDDLFKIE